MSGPEPKKRALHRRLRREGVRPDASKTVAPPARGKASAGGRPAKAPRAPIPLPGRWEGPVRDALQALLAAPSPERRIAALVLDDGVALNDAGEALFRRLVAKADFKFSREFWEMVPLQYGRERIRAGYEGFREAPASVWADDPYYRMYRKAFLRCHRDILRERGAAEAARWRAALLVGFEEAELRAYARTAVTEALREPLGEETVGDSPDDEAPLSVRTGLRTVSEWEELCRRLGAAGFEVWMLSPSIQPAAEAFASLYGVPPERVVGARVYTVNGRSSARVLDPVPAGVGRAEAVIRFVGDPPALALGGEGDEEFLGYGGGLRIVSAAAAGPKVEAWKAKGWLVQPPFSAK